MAHGGADFTTCSICRDPFDQPRMLPCGHSFCTECLKNIIGGGNKTCPDCRENIPNKRAEEFPKNYGLIAAISAPRSTGKTSTSENCTKHNLAKEFFCQADSCSVAICKKCWRSNHAHSPHNVVPIEEHLETMINKVALNTDPIMDFQNEEKHLLSRFTRKISFHESTLKKTEELVQYQLKCTASGSASELGKYEATIMEKCMSKQHDIQNARKELNSLYFEKSSILDSADVRLKELITLVHANSVQTGSNNQAVTTTKQKPNEGYRRLKSVTEMNRVEFSAVINNAAFDNTSDHLFLRCENRVHVCDLHLRELYNFSLLIEGVAISVAIRIKSIAISGNGTFYVSNVQGEQKVTSAVDKKSGEVIRNIHSDNGWVGRMSAVDNRLVIAHQSINQKKTVVKVSVYDNETFTKTLQLQTGSSYYITLASPDYLLYLQRERKNSIQLVILNIAHSNKSQKCVVHLDGLKYLSPFVWIGNKSSNSEEVTSGYLFIADCDSSPYRPLVYEIDLSTVEHGTTLSPLNIPFNLKHKYEEIWFEAAVGNDSILCSLKHQNNKHNLAIFRMNFD